MSGKKAVDIEKHMENQGNLKAKRPEKNEAIFVTAGQLGACLGLTDRRVRQLKNEGIVISARGGKYDLQKSVLSYIQNLRDRQKEKKLDLEQIAREIEQEKLEHERLKKRKTQLIVEQMEKRLHDARDVESYWNQMCVTIKSRVTAIPVKVSPVLAGMTEKDEIKQVLKREIADALTELSEYDMNLFDIEYEDEEADPEGS